MHYTFYQKSRPIWIFVEKCIGRIYWDEKSNWPTYPHGYTSNYIGSFCPIKWQLKGFGIKWLKVCTNTINTKVFYCYLVTKESSSSNRLLFDDNLIQIRDIKLIYFKMGGLIPVYPYIYSLPGISVIVKHFIILIMKKKRTSVFLLLLFSQFICSESFLILKYLKCSNLRFRKGHTKYA